MNSHQRKIAKRKNEREAQAVIKLQTELIPNPTLTPKGHPYERALNTTGDTSMNSRERKSLDRHITGNYGEDQFKDTKTTEFLMQKCAHGRYCAYCGKTMRWWQTSIGVDSPVEGPNKVVVHHSCLIDFTREMFQWIE